MSLKRTRRIPPLAYAPPQEPLNILHLDEHIIVLSKPAGLLSVPGRGAEVQDSLEIRVKAAYPEALLVHRLDMDTSGVFIMALNKDMQRNLGLQFERRKVDKTYIARVWGVVADDRGTVDLPLRCDWPNRPLQMVCYEHGRAAVTDWEVLERAENSTLVKLIPHTGRSHQLRVHMEEIGHPIIGDCFYAPDEAYAAADRLLLHAHSLEIHHPDGGARMIFRDDFPF